MIGGGFICLDLRPTLGRFDLHAHTGAPSFVQVQTSIVPLAGPTFELSADRWHVLQIIFDPFDQDRIVLVRWTEVC